MPKGYWGFGHTYSRPLPETSRGVTKAWRLGQLAPAAVSPDTVNSASAHTPH